MLKLKHVFMIKRILNKLVPENIQDILKQDKQSVGFAIFTYVLSNEDCEKPIYEFVADYLDIKIEEAENVNEDQILKIIEELIDSKIIDKLKKINPGFLARTNVLKN